MFKVNLLPKWCFPGTKPSVYDTTSGTTIEMVAKVYNEMKVLQETYNSFVDEINKSITEFMESTEQDQECFKAHIDKIMHDYIAMVDEKIKMQDLKIEEDITYIKNNIVEAAQTIINEAISNGEISLTSSYEDEILSLTITSGGGVN